MAVSKRAIRSKLACVFDNRSYMWNGRILPWRLAMERLFFLCPTTRRTIDVGVETEIGTLLRIKSSKVRAECPACGQTHEWIVRDASLPQAA